jgi:hypothetical protein
VGEDRLAIDLDHSLGFVLGKRSEARPLSSSEYDSFHSTRTIRARGMNLLILRRQ